MSFHFTAGIFKICIAQICQNIGWHAYQTSPMDILIDVLHRFLLEVSKTVQKYSNQYGRTEPNLDDIALAFKTLGISLSEIEEYVNNVEAVPFPRKLPRIPVENLTKLHHPRQGRRELAHRQECVYDYLPPMHPELEEEEGLSPAFDSGSKKSLMDNSGGADGENTSPLSSPTERNHGGHGTKRPSEWSNDIPVAKKPRHYVEEEGRPMREVTSVFMTPTGLISPVRDGKVAEPSLPHTIDSPPSTPEPPSHPLEPPTSKKESKSKDSKKEKSSKSKKEKDLGKKDNKKAKSSKKENKENTALASEKSGAASISGKKEHSSSHKSSTKSEKASKSSDLSRPKGKCDKVKVKESKEEHKKNRDHSKLGKSKSKLKHLSSSLCKSPKPSKLSKSPQKSPQKHVAKSPKKASSKSPKREKKMSVSPPAALPVVMKKEEIAIPNMAKAEVKRELKLDLSNDEADLSDSHEREESPEPRLVIDISTEAQNRQERESRMAIFDECIDAVIQRGQEETELEDQKSKSFDKTIDEVARGPIMRRLEPKDIYDFTDCSEISSLSSLEPDDSPMPVPIKKDQYDSTDSESDDSVKKEKVKGKQMKKAKDFKRASGPLISPKNQKSPNVIVKREERSPSPIKLKEEIFSSDESVSSRSPSPANFFDLPKSQKHPSGGPSISEGSPQESPFMPSSAPSTSYSGNPFAPIRSLPCQIQSNPHFPTPPLFQTSKSDQGSMFQNTASGLPLNLAKSNPSTKGFPDNKTPEPHDLSSKADDAFESKKSKSEVLDEKVGKGKIHRKEKKEKVEKKERFKKKIKEKEKQKPKEKKVAAEPKRERGRPRLDKNAKEDKKNKIKADKKKEKDEKDDSSVTKFTLKITGGNSGKCCIKPSGKNSSQPSSPLPKDSTPSPSPSRAASPSPPSSPAKPATPPPLPSPVPSPVPPALVDSEVPVTMAPPAKSTHSRGRGRGRKPAAQPAVQPPARTVITETLGTIVDESGNKIWICPACTRPDDGSPMIGCDECDDWYHWVCVGIVVPPKEEESWFCTRCISKRQSVPVKRRRKKHKKDK